MDQNSTLRKELAATFAAVINALGSDEYFTTVDVESPFHSLPAIEHLHELAQDAVGEGPCVENVAEALRTLRAGKELPWDRHGEAIRNARRLVYQAAAAASSALGIPDPLQTGAEQIAAVFRNCIRLEQAEPGYIPFLKLPLMGVAGVTSDSGYVALDVLKRVALAENITEIGGLRNHQERLKLLGAALYEVEQRGLQILD